LSLFDRARQLTSEIYAVPNKRPHLQPRTFFHASLFDWAHKWHAHALAVASAARWEALPDIPTVGEFVPGYEGSSWLGVGAPKNTPSEIIDKLNKQINAGLADPKLKTQLAGLGETVLALSSAEFGTLIADDTEKWAKVIRAANIKPD